MAVSSALSSELCNPVCPHRTLVHFYPTFFCWSIVWMSANEILCTGPLIGHLGFQQTPFSPWHTKSLLIFTAIYYVGFFSWLCCSGLGPWQGVKFPYPSVFSHAAQGTGLALFTSWLFLPVGIGLLRNILDYKASVHLVLSWLFRLIAL